MLLDVLEAVGEETLNLLVPVAEFLKHVQEQRLDIAFAEGAEARRDLQGTLLGGRRKWAKHDARGIGPQHDAGALYVHSPSRWSSKRRDLAADYDKQNAPASREA